ncbi:unnamed protein product [Bursaphelenchus okinawaensis]|uniref:G_PROTEIN_RECEP_F1_2 domain-containing protein n=1 Tax=Bursaphelenchus okinawaensis TaxID=465554 RepID=A0A811LHG1_9BILA|nr:unnamed protein product [Bursaphelenchus okinawaensis]CAG9125450.1 unnamed protein product [Bursaphelenchus okinawaensis]
MTLPDPLNCTEALVVSTSRPLVLVVTVHWLCSFLFLLIVVVFVVKGSFSKFFSIIHPNFRILFKLATFFGVLHSLFIIALRTENLRRVLLYEDNCDFQWSPVHCLSLKLPIYYCVFSFTATHFCLFLERAYATLYTRTYHDDKRSVGFILMTLLFTMICAATVDLIATIGDSIVFRVNFKRRFFSSTYRFSNYSLSNSFQTRENKMTILLILPLSIIHSSFFLSYLGISIVMRSYILDKDPLVHVTVIEVMQTAVCTYLIVISLALSYLWKRTERQFTIVQDKGPGGELHFEQLRLQFERVVPFRR